MPRLECSLCHALNDHLAVVCASCGSFLQARVENLDLFLTAWRVLERPAQAFRTVAIARHKNYVVVLSAFAGYAFTFFAFWLVKAGDHTDSLVNFLAAGLAVGPAVGIIVMTMIAAFLALVLRIAGARSRFRNVFAVSAYALVPIVISAALVLPIEIMTFGLYFFTTNPSPAILKPVSYYTLLGLDGLFALWSLLVFVTAVRVLGDVSWRKAWGAGAVALVLFCGLVYGLARLLLPSVL